MHRIRLCILIAGMAALLTSCQQGQTSSGTTSPATTAAATTEPSNSGFKKISVQEVLQTSQYTYLHGKVNDQDTWLAVPSMQAKAGDIYYYEGGLQMTKFESKELSRVFESIVLLEKINTEPKSTAVAAAGNPGSPAATESNTTNSPETMMGEQYKRTPPKIEKQDVKVNAAKGGITIAELYDKKDAYAGKTVTIKGKVTKYTPAVMSKNWIHIQDGTESNGKFDLAITSDAEVKVGDVVTFEGKIGLNKDLGYGYFFDVIMEDAAARK
jgi:NOL1/NOP2/fmu family ribosome biogenesis protein